jgi:hypothetical protein
MFAISFIILEAAWEVITVIAIHNEDVRLSQLAMLLSGTTPVYLSFLLFFLAGMSYSIIQCCCLRLTLSLGNPFFFDGLMLFKVFFLVVLSILNRVVVEVLAHRLRASFGQGFRSRILPKLNLLALALPLRCLPDTATCYVSNLDLQVDFRAQVDSSVESSPSAADL